MSDVFVSYARGDRPMAEALAQLLGRQRWSVWWDRDIDYGKPFDEVIEDELDQARCVVVLWSRKSAQSHWVRSEARRGAERGVLVPVLIDQQAQIPLEFRDIQTANVSGWHGGKRAEVAQLLAQISQILRLPMSDVAALDLREAWRAIVVEESPTRTCLRVELSWDKHDVIVYYEALPSPNSALLVNNSYGLAVDGDWEVDRIKLSRKKYYQWEFKMLLMDGDKARRAVLAASVKTKNHRVLWLDIIEETWACSFSVEGRTLYTFPAGTS